MDDILQKLDHEPSYCEHSDAKQLRREAAEEIRQLREQVAQMNNLLLRKASDKMSRRVAA